MLDRIIVTHGRAAANVFPSKSWIYCRQLIFPLTPNPSPPKRGRGEQVVHRRRYSLSIASGPPGNRTPISALRRRRLPVGRAAQKRSGRDSNPVFRAYQGGVLPQHFQTIKLRPMVGRSEQPVLVSSQLHRSSEP